MSEEEKVLAARMRIIKFTDKELERQVERAMEGNIPANFNIILHNQRIINDKLNKLLKKPCQKKQKKNKLEKRQKRR